MNTVSDTIKKVDKNLIISETVSRENIWVAKLKCLNLMFYFNFKIL